MFIGRKFTEEGMTRKNDMRRNLHANPRYTGSSDNASMADIVKCVYKD